MSVAKARKPLAPYLVRPEDNDAPDGAYTRTWDVVRRADGSVVEQQIATRAEARKRAATLSEAGPIEPALPAGAIVLRNNPMVSGGRSGTVHVEPARLSRLLGTPTWQSTGPDPDSDGKVDREYVIRLASIAAPGEAGMRGETIPGATFRLYAYKATNLYEPGLPTPEKFWQSGEPFAFSIGTSDGTNMADVLDYLRTSLGIDATDDRLGVRRV